ncbi:hypothetical protein D2E76_16590 [Mycobacteroides abscessus]|uniref:Uncharacterized protein n=2 Tax=Mycobacteroides abscessus TaxID=36809 RepID=A0ABD7HMV6_9MYCO|nr:hypothetical protein D2E76_16590 [Mycobacteroides abscessus]
MEGMQGGLVRGPEPMEQFQGGISAPMDARPIIDSAHAQVRPAGFMRNTGEDDLTPAAPAPPPATVERGGTSAQFDPRTPADQQLKDWGWDPNSLNPAQLEVMARRYAHPDKPLAPHVDNFGRPVAPDELGADDLANAWLHANPDVNGTTKFLPLIGDEDTDKKIIEKDAQLQKVNAASVGIRPGELGYRSANLNGTASEISNMEGPAQKLKSAVEQAIELHGQLRELYSGQYASGVLTKIGKARTPKLDEHIAALKTDAVAAHKAMTDTGAGALNAFRGFHDVVDGYREDIARAAVTPGHGRPVLRSPLMLGQAFAEKDEHGFCEADPKAAVAAGAQQAFAAGDAMGKLFTTPVDGVTSVEAALPKQHSAGGSIGGAGGPGGLGGGGALGNTGSGGPGGGLTPEQAMAPFNGMGIPPVGAPQGPQLPQAPQIPVAGAGPGPHTGLAADHNADQPLHDSLDPSKEHDRRTSAEARAADAALASPPLLRAGDPVRPGQLGADMKPLDKDGDGRMDADAVAPTQHNMDKDHDGKPDMVPTAVIIGGVPHPVEVDDPRLLEIMNIFGSATPEHPADVLDAAHQAGVPLSSYGTYLDDPMSAKTGDVLTGSKGTGMYLGGGQVLMEDGTKQPLIDVAEFRPPGAGFFRLELPELPVGAEDSVNSSAPAPASAPTPPPPVPPEQPTPEQQPAPQPETPPAPTSAATMAAAVQQQSAPEPPPESDLPFPSIPIETAPRSW